MSLSTLSTLNESIDLLLQDGIRSKCITYICGPHNTGKTQLCLQLTFALQFFRGDEPQRTMYLRSNQLYPNIGSIERLEGISNGLLDKMKNSMRFQPDSDLPILQKANAFNVSASLKNTMFCESNDSETIFDLLSELPPIVTKQNIKLLIIDDIDEHLNSSGMDENELNVHFTRFLQLLHNLAVKHDLAVVITGSPNMINGRLRDIPYTPEAYFWFQNSLEEVSRFQINLDHIFQNRYRVTIVKSPFLYAMNINYRSQIIQITTTGVHFLELADTTPIALEPDDNTASSSSVEIPIITIDTSSDDDSVIIID